MNRIPLAWKNLTHNLSRLAISLLGVAFAVVLMFMQRGFQLALFDSTVQIVRQLDAEIFLVSKARFALSSDRRFPLEKLVEARSVAGVDSAEPLYLEAFLSNFRGHRPKSRPIRVVGVNLRNPPFRPEAEINSRLPRLETPQTALYDTASKSAIYGIDLSALEAGDPVEAELAGRELHLVGGFRLGTDFANDGNLIMSAESFADYFPFRNAGAPLSYVDVGLIRCAGDREQVAAVKRRLEQLAGNQLTVYTRDEFIHSEMRFWATNTPIGTVFGIGTLMGFVVGVIICYQIIYTDIQDHMPEFATLMAMGYPRRYFVMLIVCQAFYLSLLGFLPGILISYGLFQLIASQTGLAMLITVPRAAVILAFTILMCLVSGGLAIRKLVAADPASLF